MHTTCRALLTACRLAEHVTHVSASLVFVQPTPASAQMLNLLYVCAERKQFRQVYAHAAA
jgi:hypothetical protein